PLPNFQSGPPGWAARSRGRFPPPLVAPLAEPVEPVRGYGLGETGLRDQHVVTSGGNALETGSPELPQLPLDPVARNGVPGSLWHGKAKPRVPRIVLALEPVEDEEACGRRASLPVDGVKVSRARQAMPALHFVLYAERRVRPLARRRLSMARPARVDIRARKPCRRFRRRTLG